MQVKTTEETVTTIIMETTMDKEKAIFA